MKKNLNAKTGRSYQRKGEAIGGIEPMAVPLSVDNRGHGTDREALEERTFRSRYSQLTREQIRELEDWGKSKDGYTGGGNYDDNPDLAVYTLAKYHQMKVKG